MFQVGDVGHLPVSDARGDAVKALLGSGVFDRSPSQERLFLYLCEKYFAGMSAELKEYTVATEVLGKSSDFDPKDDSIVRVEMHRLRKRLREYYARRGSGDPVKVILPEKSYELEFQFENSLMPVVEVARPRAAISRNWTLWAVACGVGGALLLVGYGYFGGASGKDSAAASEPAVSWKSGAATDQRKSISPAPKGKEVRILCGRAELRYTDQYGHAWQGDRYFTGGEPLLIESTANLVGYDANILSGLRQGVFRYRIPVDPGVYEVTMVFAEPTLAPSASVAPQEETREFGVWINRQQVLDAFDVKDAAGGYNLAHFRVYKDVEPGSDGVLELEFGRGTQRAFVNAILIRPGIRGKMRPVRLVARRQAFVDQQGNLWEADQFFQGGRTISRPVPPAGVANSWLYVGERHGTFTYTIPVPAGTYGATLYFWESWWGEGRQGGGGVGSRLFDVYCNFRPLLERFDILGSTEPPNVARKTFHGLTPDGQGRLTFSFVPRANRAMVNAIEVFQE
jgi:hypothetical protein